MRKSMHPWSAARSLMPLCAALKSRETATKEPCGSSCWKVRATSNPDGIASFSGILLLTFALQIELSKTRRGSRPSAITMLSLPTAVRCGQRASASARVPSKGFTQPCSISFATSSSRSCGFFSACVQLPWQCSRCMPSRSASSMGCCCCTHCMLDGMGSKMPVLTPSSSIAHRSASGSPVASAKSRSSASRKG